MSLVETLRTLRAHNQKVLVVGMGISGVETATFLLKLGIKPICTERMDEVQFRSKSKFVAQADALMRDGATIAFGVDGEKVAPYLSEVGLAVLSPGVGLETAIVGTIERSKIPVISELELGVQLHQGKTIVITGSIGKSTTASLLHAMLMGSGIDSILCGNVGTPVVSSPHLQNVLDDSSRPATLPVLVVEASSYQLESCTVIKPTVSIFLNLVENHLERHGSMERYGAAKAHVFARQDKEDLLICSFDDKRVFELGKSAKATLALFGDVPLSELQPYSKWNAAVRYEGTKALVILNLDGQQETYDTTDARLLGRHNRVNMAAALLAARKLGASPTDLLKVLVEFSPLEHRLEKLTNTKTGLEVINDSKSTTVAAAVAAVRTILESYPQQTITLLIGGLSKAGSWDPLFSELIKARHNIIKVVCFGKDGPLLASHAENHKIEFSIVHKLKDAVQKAFEITKDGGVILLSPGCASFDEFSDFEHRGHVFRELVASQHAV